MSKEMELPPPIQNLLNALEEMDALNRAHVASIEKLDGDNGWRKDCDSIFTKSGITLLCSAWEAYIEDTARDAARFMVDNISDPEDLPLEIRKTVAKAVKGEVNELAVWKISSEGWRSYIIDKFEELAMSRVNRLNSPKSQNIKSIFFTAIGVNDITKAWCWEGFDSQWSSSWIDILVTTRGAIAHGKKASITVGSYTMTFFKQLVFECAHRVNNRVAEHLESVTNKRIWGDFHVKQNWERFSTLTELPHVDSIMMYERDGDIFYVEYVPIGDEKKAEGEEYEERGSRHR
jgi:hypothetical protein